MYLKDRRLKVAVQFKWLRIGISGGLFVNTSINLGGSIKFVKFLYSVRKH